MKISFLLELLLVCVLIAFASSMIVKGSIQNDKSNDLKPKQEEQPIDYAQEQEDYVQEEEPTVEEITHHDDELDIENEVIQQQHDALNDTLPLSAEQPAAAAVEDVITNNDDAAVQTDVNTNDPNPINKFCTCSKSQCKCCRDFALPLVLVRGPGCATVRYIEEDKMAIQIKYGDFVLASRTVSGKKATPICLPLPGGFTRFCGRVYGISRKGDEFKACLGLDLRAEDEVEASLRVSCFNFGPRGVEVAPSEPIPQVVKEEDEDDDDDDILGLGGIGGGDDDEDDDDDDAEDDDDGEDGGVVSDLLSIVT